MGDTLFLYFLSFLGGSGEPGVSVLDREGECRGLLWDSSSPFSMHSFWGSVLGRLSGGGGGGGGGGGFSHAHLLGLSLGFSHLPAFSGRRIHRFWVTPGFSPTCLLPGGGRSLSRSFCSLTAFLHCSLLSLTGRLWGRGVPSASHLGTPVGSHTGGLPHWASLSACLSWVGALP